MRNPPNTALIAFTANLLGVTSFQSPQHAAFTSRKAARRKSRSPSSAVRLTAPRSKPRYFLDSSEHVLDHQTSDAILDIANQEDVLVYRTEGDKFSLLKPYQEFNELDLQQLFKDDAKSISSLYQDIEEVEIGHYKSSDAATAATSPFYFCQQKSSSPETKLPPWLSLLDPARAPQHLARLRNDLAPHLSPKQISSVIVAIRTAAKNDVQLAGAADFCSLLVNSLEMSDVSALIGSAFHYCSLVGVRERETGSVSRDGPDLMSSALFSDPDTKYLCALAGSGIEAYSPHSMKIALDAARLKSIEALAARVVKTSTSSSSNLRSLLLSINEEGDWRALAIRSAACLYRLKGLRKWREDGNGNGERRTEEESRVGHEALHIYAPLGECMK
jgi:hypothetical protein